MQRKVLVDRLPPFRLVTHTQGLTRVKRKPATRRAEDTGTVSWIVRGLELTSQTAKSSPVEPRHSRGSYLYPSGKLTSSSRSIRQVQCRVRC